MRYGSVCSGIEAATVAWPDWEPVFFSEIDPFPRAVLEHHYPNVPLMGDFTEIKGDEHGPIDLLVGGTPCQSFSLAGLRAGMDDHRGNLALEFLKLADRTRTQWVVWENVPGILSSNGGRDFGSFLGGMAELGYGFAYRVLNAQYFGVPQRRRRVFVVGYLGDWRPPAAVLLERESLRRNPAPSVSKGQGPSDRVAPCLDSSYHRLQGTAGQDLNTNHGHLVVAFPAELSGTQCAATEELSPALSVTHTTAVAYGGNDTRGAIDVATACLATHSMRQDFATETLLVESFSENQRGEVVMSDQTRALATEGGKPGQGYQAITDGRIVRRLSAIECERLQGFPDNYTQIPYRNKPAQECPNGPRFKALGNTMAVPVMSWIGKRIDMVSRNTK